MITKGSTVLAQEGRNFQVLLGSRSRRGPPLIAQLAARTLTCRGNTGSPCHTGLYGTAGRCIIGNWSLRLGTPLGLLLSKIETDIGGQALEQGASIARLGIVTILSVL